MIKCYVDGKYSDCDIADCNTCKKGIAQLEQEEGFEDNFSQAEADQRERDEYFSQEPEEYGGGNY